ncbi:hypothetical protein RND81_11G236900 [Saponaria officinalis]|uniref:NAB domain-containing protein n=1 Tax=Saponaria officinalis TaxID=3572 RepID=A0AAW1HQW1_SAPOF
MLQRAASNAYSWWWASHVRTKQSKWLEQSLQDMGDKVETVLKLITQDGDSFAKRAEMYYKHRPELISFVEESFRAYQSLAERFDHISKELQNANSTLASAFPDQFQYQMDDDDDFPSPRGPRKFQVEKPPNPNIPKAPQKFPTKSIKAYMALTNSKKTSSKTAPKSASHANKVPKSGLSKSEALTEIDKLQKQILTFQTEKEFAKSSYESGYAKYWNIEEEITEMQERISKLQDEFGISQAIDDDEARTLMAQAAIKSCQDTLAQLQEKQERGAEEANTERQRIKDAREKLRSLKGGELAHDYQADVSETADYIKPEEKCRSSFGNEMENLGESKDLEMLRDKIKEHFDVGATNMLTVSEMAEKIDELVNKVINLETAVSSQTALIHTLRSETDELQSHIKNLEDEKSNLIEGKNDLSEKVSEMENKLKGLHDLDRSFQQQDSSLTTHFGEARSNLDTISKKLHDVKPDAEFEKSSQSQEYGKIIAVADAKTELLQDISEKNIHLPIVTQSDNREGTAKSKSNIDSPIINDPQTHIQPSLEESKSTTLVIGQPEEPFNIKVEEQVNPQGIQQQPATLSTNEHITPKEIQSKETPNNRVDEPTNPQRTQQQPPHLSAKEPITPQDVRSEVLPNTKAEEPLNPQGTQQQPATLFKDEPVAPREFQSEETSNSKEEEPSTQHQPATPSTNNPITLQQVKSEETAKTKAKEPVNPQETQLQPATLPVPEQVDQQFQQIASASVPKHEPVTLEDVLRRESVTALNDRSDVPYSVHRQGQTKTQDKLVTLEDVLRRETVTELKDGSNAPSVHQQSQTKKEDEPDWQQLFMNGLEGKEKVLLAEYTNTLRNYKEAKKKMAEIEKKSQLDVSGIEAQLKELKNYNAMKDEEIYSLRQKLNALQRRMEEYNKAKEENSVGPARFDDLSSPFEDEEDFGIRAVVERDISPAEAKLRADIDEILEENLDFWMRFSASFGQIQKFQNGVQDLFSELTKIEKDREKKDGSNHGTPNASQKSDIRPIYKHLREIETELTLWLEQSEKLKEELQRRFSQLCNIQEEIRHAENAGAVDDEMRFTSYNAAKFQGEVANMLQENNKVRDELQAGMDHITGLQADVECTVTRLNEELGFYGTKSQNEDQMRSGNKGKVPLRSFIFGVKPPKKKQSIFSRMHPGTMHKKYHQLKADKSP